MIQTIKEMLESVGQTAGSFYKDTTPYAQLNEPILTQLCNIWSKYPKSVLLNPYARGFGRAMCNQAGKNVPPVPAPKFTGGQCSGSFYDVTFIITRNNSSGVPVTTSNLVPNRRGKIFDAGITYISAPTLAWYFYIYYEPLNAPNPYIGIVPGYQLATPHLDNIILTPVPGSPDNCGNPPPEYPPDPPRDPVDFVKPVTYNIYNSAGDTVNKINTNITFDINSNFDIPFNFHVDGVEFTFNYNGIDVAPPPPTPKPRPKPDNYNPSPTPNPPPPEANEDYIPDPQPDKVADKRTYNDTLVYVQLTVTGKPANAKSQWGAGAPDVYYCGWFEFLINGRAINRVPVHFIENVFVAPENANGYAYTLYVGFMGSAKAYIKRDVVPLTGLPKILPA